uniref:Uncharacterized protein n=1 Tax=Setaria viridis TaxID=4556 RepID=A0A4U6SPM7_SETVI|nr:hypothetical protein SEVIR_9G039100v2 [Setaria viridis]
MQPRRRNPHGGGGGRYGAIGTASFKRSKPNRRGAGAIAAPPAAPQAIPDDVLQLFFKDATTQMKQSLLQYVRAGPHTILTTVPGDTRKYKKRSDHARLATSAKVSWYYDLHFLGWSLEGNARHHEFGIDHLGYLKGHTTLLKSLKKVSLNGRSKDMLTCANCIEHAIHPSSPSVTLPEDLMQLIHLLRNFDPKYYPLVLGHVCHEVEAVKCALYVKMFNRLMVLKRANITTYFKIMKALPYSNVWISEASKNVHPAHVLHYDGRQMSKKIKKIVLRFLTTRIKYDTGAEGLLNFRRNGEARLEKDYSVDFGGRVEAALTGAKAVFDLQPGVAAGPPNPIDRRLASRIGSAVAAVLQKSYSSPEAAKQAAIAAATTVAQHPNLCEEIAQNRAAKAAKAAAAKAAVWPPAVPQAPLMFDSDQIEHMFDVSTPLLLAQFQKAMFDEWQVFQLDDGQKVACLL